MDGGSAASTISVASKSSLPWMFVDAHVTTAQPPSTMLAARWM